jgi:ABC-type nitrate/sulfonate/bicarbonate transport system substrate-binding protein
MGLRTALFVTIAALVAALSGPARAAEGKLENVVLTNPAISLSFSASYLAEDLGLFEKNGLKVKTIEIPGVGSANAVISGSADFAQISSITLTRAAAKGQRMLGIVETTDKPIIQVSLRKDLAEAAGFDPKASFAQRAAALRGHTIAVDATGSLIHGYVLLMAKRAGIPRDDVHVAIMQPPNMIAAFKSKQIDGIAMSPPWAMIPVVQGEAVMIASGPDGDPKDLDPFVNNVVVTMPATCEKRRAVCMGMGHAFAAAEAYIHDHPQEALALLKKRFSKLDDKVLAAAFETVRKISPNPPIINVKGLENAEVFNIDAGLMKPEEKLKSYAGLTTDAFVK